ncbi:MAG: hypothetical protein QOH23_1491 [Gaiellaceae bacterium]|nr:hypothetical protein [Gaiellaceae bacterium]
MNLTMPTVAADPEPSPIDDPARRGRLLIDARAARRVVEGVLTRAARGVVECDARVTSLTDSGIELEISITIDYPTEPLSGILRQLRLDLAEEAGRQLGRPIQHVDLTVSKFATPAKQAARRAPRRVI